MVGFAFGELSDEWWTLKPKKAEAVMVFVTKKYRNKGFGSRLMEKRRDWAIKKGVTHIFAKISSQNNGSIKLHRKLGFKSKQVILEEKF